jgi:hypothetical protein
MESLLYFTSPIRVANDARLLRTLSRRSVQPPFGSLRGEGAKMQPKQCTRFVHVLQLRLLGFLTCTNRPPVNQKEAASSGGLA